jgi:UDP-glucuronate 4-epimerase
MDKLQTILVTGGAGFIGSHLCEALLKQSFQVVCLDNFNDFYEPALKKHNLRQALLSANFTLIEGDIRDAKVLDEVFSLHAIDVVIHLAAMAGVRPSLANPELYQSVNINGTFCLLEKCRQHRIQHFVFASSSSVYGNNEKVPFAETDNVDHPISPYAYTKKAGELLTYLYHHLHQMNVVCLRFFTVYGPRQRPDLAIRKFAEAISADKPILIFGDGHCRRDYTYIDDIVNGILQAMNYMQKQPGYEIFNLGNSHTVSLLEMISELEKQLGKSAIKQFEPQQPGDVRMTFADITKSKNLLGFEPKTNLPEGIHKFLISNTRTNT